MKRLVAISALVLLAGFVFITISKRSRDAAVPGAQDSAGISDERKAEIRRFWDVYRQATALRGKGEWKAAAAAYRDALTIDGEHEDALYHLGNMLFELGEYDDAIAIWRRLAGVNPLATRAFIQLGAAYSCGAEGTTFDLEVAEQEFQHALAINKEQTGPILRLGEVYLLSGNREKALTYFTMATQTNVKSIEAHYLIGFIRWLDGDADEARDALGIAVEYSREKRPTGQPLREGDTEYGSGPILTEGAVQRNFFARHWKSLKEWDDVDISNARMDNEYQGLGRQLQSLISRSN